MLESWWPIVEYRDFYDVPHAIVVRTPSVVLYLDSSFDFELDDYQPEYTVYRLPEALARSLPKDWTRLHIRGALMGSVPVSSVRFDRHTNPTRLASDPLVGLISGDIPGH